jgi:hypothetical protein
LDRDARIMTEFLDAELVAPKGSGLPKAGSGRESVPLLFKREVMQRRLIGG